MMICRSRFNIIFCVALAIGLSLLPACQSLETKQKSQVAILRVHLENPFDRSDRTKKVPVWRANPVMVNIETQPFLTEYNVKEAKVVDTVGGFLISIQMDKRGTYLLEQYSSASHGKRFAIFSEFALDPDSKTNYARWLGAPKISTRISDGVLSFTPDADRSEAYSIVLGLNNTARKIEKGLIW